MIFVTLIIQFGCRSRHAWSTAALVGIFLIGCKPRDIATVSNDTAAASSADKATTAIFEFVTHDPKVLSNCQFSNGKEAGLNSILEIVGGGVGCIDYDLDGCIDLFFPRGGGIDANAQQVLGAPSTLMRGNGMWGFHDCSSAAHADSPRIYAHGISAVDFDQDGFGDLLVYGYGGVILLSNQGDGTFADITDFAGLASAPWTTAAAWIDVNQDQNLDLYLGSYVDWNFEKHQVCAAKNGQPDVCSPNAFDGMLNSVFLNNGVGTFTFAPHLLQASQPSKTLGTLAAEFRSGGGTGLYVANDLIANFLFTPRDGNYVEHGVAAGVAVDDAGVANGSMGIALLDFNLDRKFDLFVTNFEHELMALYLNVDGDSFNHVSRQVGLNRSELQVVAFGTVAGDFDGDADEDVVFTSGHVHYFPDAGKMEQQPVYLQNEAGRSFLQRAPKGRYFSDPRVGRGLATADLDDDGDLDLVGTSLFGPPSLNENTGMISSHWLTISLIGVHCPRTPIGATAELTVGAKGSTTLIRQLFSGGSYLSHSQQQLHFAWPKAQARSQSPETASLVILWPDGTSSPPMQVTADQRLTIVQPKQP